ncbi:hypothetical protein EZV62_023804 [Acer yangbiense]|uniref:CCHC-type domain-containing protein n=1 Tax=Acer yangbiense TaxID=1000413 RepID=A0A5C7H2S5_9ROSI|nr:hypothetical protein EZV62_023804 [Acer yangbiense]
MVGLRRDRFMGRTSLGSTTGGGVLCKDELWPSSSDPPVVLSGKMDIFKIIVLVGNEKVELGECDADHISLITLVHALTEKFSGKKDDHGLDTIVFEVNSACYVPTLPEVSSPTPNAQPEVLDMDGGYQALGWCDLEVEMFNYEGDSEKYDDKDDDDDFVDGDDEITKQCMDLFEGYQSKSDDEYFSNLELEPEQVKIAKLDESKESRTLKIIATGDIEYKLLGPTGRYVVKLIKFTYQYGGWQVSGIPYSHAMAAIIHSYGRAVEKDKKWWLKVPTCIHIESQTEHMNPPHRTIQPGRLKSQRKREPDEAAKEGRSGIVVCRGCGNAGHNQRTCQSKKKNKTTGTSVGVESSEPPIQPHSTFVDFSSQPPTQSPPQSQVTQQHLD